MYFTLLCDKCVKTMFEIHSSWIEDGETYEKTFKCPSCKSQISIAIPFSERLKDWKNTTGVIKMP